MPKAKTKPPPAERTHEPHAGRYAFICTHEVAKDTICANRRFMTAPSPAPECDKHGKMTRQGNRAYRGQTIPE